MHYFFKKFFKIFIFIIIAGFIYPSSSYAKEPITNWSSSVSLPYLIASHVSFLYKDKLYVNAGSSATGFSKFNTLSSLINQNGTINNWYSDSALLPEALIFHTIAVKDNYVYILGGREENAGSHMGDVPTVYLGVIDSNGVINNWQTVTPLPTASHLGGAVVVNNTLYYAHGSTLWKNTINSNGTLGSWTTAGSLPQFIPGFGLSGFGLIEHNNHLLLVGGRLGNSADSDHVYTSSINADGTINGWVEINELPQPINRGHVVKVDDTLFMIGGNNNTGMLDAVYYTKINDSGYIEPWKTSAYSLPKKICCGGIAASDKYLYLTGGFSGDYLDSVYFTKLAVSNELNVPLIKQTSEPWQSKEYDSAHIWSPSYKTIHDWGCALTSATMVFQYNGLTKLPDGQPLNPGTVNIWLKNQIDGYVNDGWVNWLALVRLSRLAVPTNNITAFDALEYHQVNGKDFNKLTENIENNLPGILEVPMHFIVAKGISDDTFTINDPYFERYTLKDEYNNTFKKLGWYTPSNTNLSYIMLVADPAVTLQVKDSTGAVVAESYVQEALQNEEHENIKNNSLTMLYFAKPATGQYEIVATSSSDKVFTLSSYLYDQNGDVSLKKDDVVVGNNNPANVTIQFNQESASASAIERIVTFQSTINDILLLKNQKQINPGVATALKVFITNAERMHNKNKHREEKKMLTNAKKHLLNIAKHAHLIKPQAYKILKADIEGLLEIH